MLENFGFSELAEMLFLFREFRLLLPSSRLLGLLLPAGGLLRVLGFCRCLTLFLALWDIYPLLGLGRCSIVDSAKAGSERKSGKFSRSSILWWVTAKTDIVKSESDSRIIGFGVARLGGWRLGGCEFQIEVLTPKFINNLVTLSLSII